MNCKKAHVLMSCAVDGELTPKEEKEFLLHLSECKSCTEAFAEAKKTKLIIREKILRVKAPQSLVDSVLKLGVFPGMETEKNLIFDQIS
ncbi:putative transmembrane anti-sigma factor [Chlorobium limicola DSM 245]|jgi:anti-sigma factor RsiW|uniref:Putative transmembrane anti-sigma factor n=1 Tax=Chlorobium limicola (strain DSM 245 / NBRC 103803 / 6330) TaxID=290315 RepID=B3EHR4_CHLL2|nr:zf-HC2 domain-containing protein [Chlorobium limicola]ACD89844.1 putative transmembrane anti-sigma factor [Chlorobium limicola DSM 245]